MSYETRALTEAINQLAEAVTELTASIRKASEPVAPPEMRPPPADPEWTLTVPPKRWWRK